MVDLLSVIKSLNVAKKDGIRRPHKPLLLLLVPLLALPSACRQSGSAPPQEETDSDSSACDSPGPALEVEWLEMNGAVPMLSWIPPEAAIAAELSFEDGPWRQSWTVDVWTPGEALQISFPMPPNLETVVNLRVEYDQGGCTNSALELKNGSSSRGDLPLFTSTWDPSTATSRDWFLFDSILDVDDGVLRGQVVLIQDNGSLVGNYTLLEATRTQFVSSTGAGFWSYSQTAYYDPAAIEQHWTSILTLTGWSGELIQLYDTVPYSHHDWVLSSDERFLTTLTREIIPEILDRCGVAVYGDQIIRAEIGGETQEVLWSSVDNAFPLPEGCEVFESVHSTYVSYLNGLSAYGDTLAASASGSLSSVLVGTADGSWWLMYDNQSSTPELGLETVVDFPSDDRHTRIFDDPHSAICTEGVDWGAGSSWPTDAVTCLVSNRRSPYFCHTADLVMLDRAGRRIHWVATWPEIGSDDCLHVNENGNISLIGAPNPAGDGQTRLALFSPEDAQIDVLQLQINPDGTAEFSSEYMLRETPEDSSTHLKGFFLLAMPSLGSPHHIERLTPAER